MNKIWILTCFIFLRNSAFSQIDTLVDVGNLKLNFQIVKGNGGVILFESGAGNDGTIWDTLLMPLLNATHATLITYDRAGFGKSTIDTTRTQIRDGILDLETGLDKLGYNGGLMVVAHSYGAFYARMLSAKQPKLIKSVILIDGNHVNFYTHDFITREILPITKEIEKVKKENLGIYYLYRNFPRTVSTMRGVEFPKNTPVMDIVSEKTPFHGIDSLRWRAVHREFVASSSLHRCVIANNGHYVFLENTKLIINTIVNEYYRLKE